MKSNIIKYFGAFALLLILVHSCKKNEVDKVELNNQFAISLFSDTVRISELLKVMDSSIYEFVEVAPDGGLSAYFADSITNAVTADDILQGLGDITFEFDERFELPVVPASPVPVPVDIPLDSLFSIPFVYDGYEIEAVSLKSGSININFSTNFKILDEFVLSTDNIKLADGSNFEVTVELDGGNHNINIDLKDSKIIPTDNNIIFSARVVGTVSDQGIGGFYDFDVAGAVRNLHLKSLDGTIEDLSFDFSASNALSFNLKNMYGDLKVATPQFHVKYLNSFGFLANGNIDSLYLICQDGEHISLFEEYPVEISLHSTGNTYDYITGLDQEMVDYINLLEQYQSFYFKGNLVMTCDEMSENMITEDSHIDIIADLTMPLEFNIENLIFIDTLNFNLSLGESEQDGANIVETVFDELEFKFVFGNALPLQIVPQVYMLENGTVIDSIFEGGSHISGSFDGVNTEDVIVVRIKDQQLHNIQLADQLLLKLSLTSLGNDVVINANDYFNLKVGVKTKTTEIYLDDLNF